MRFQHEFLKSSVIIAGYSISKSKLTLSASPCRIIDTVRGPPSRHV
ncbi:hypothetical protein [Nitrosomonas communis]|nr:hypothetical protein [Nitrosomonas communis]